MTAHAPNNSASFWKSKPTLHEALEAFDDYFDSCATSADIHHLDLQGKAELYGIIYPFLVEAEAKLVSAEAKDEASNRDNSHYHDYIRSQIGLLFYTKSVVALRARLPIWQAVYNELHRHQDKSDASQKVSPTFFVLMEKLCELADSKLAQSVDKVVAPCKRDPFDHQPPPSAGHGYR